MILPTIFILIAFILFIVSTVCLFASSYLTGPLQITSFSQILYNLDFGVEGSTSQVWERAIAAYWEQYLAMDLIMLFCTILLIGFVIASRKRRPANHLGLRKKRIRPVLISSLVLFLASGFTFADSAWYALDKVGYFEYAQQREIDAGFYERYYVRPSSDLLTFPENKKNVIMIWVESLETTLASTEHGGALEVSAIPNLENLALANVNFASDGNIGGAFQTTNTSWTIAGMLAESAGIPLAYNNQMTVYTWEEETEFLPGAVSLGDLLEEEGYRNVLRFGSSASYAGRANYFSQHGSYEIHDYDEAIETGLIPEGYKVWWGHEDEKLYEFAKNDLEELSSSEQPFNYAILTADTHFPDGYLCEDCPWEYDTNIENVYAHTDEMLESFLEWITAQPFFKDTVIMIAGDHLSMDETVSSMRETDPRKVYFTLIHAKRPEDRDRIFTTMDIFPTLLDAMDVRIEGDRLGFGTSLYSGKPTMVETIGLEEINEQLMLTSEFYIREIMQVDEIPEAADVEVKGY